MAEQAYFLVLDNLLEMISLSEAGLRKAAGREGGVIMRQNGTIESL